MDQVASLPAAKSALEATTDTSLRVPCYCEENVWRLVYRKLYHDNRNKQLQQQLQQDHHRMSLQENNHGKNMADTVTYHVVFVSNPKACVPMFQQLASTHRTKPVFWDYHVILLEVSVHQHDETTDNLESITNHNATIVTPTTATTTYVWDIDSHLPCPCPLIDYIDNVFPNVTNWPLEYRPYFRVIDAETYLRYFSSDRSHMYNIETKEWNAPPPSYDCILQNNRFNNNGNNNTTRNNVGNGDDVDGLDDDDDTGGASDREHQKGMGNLIRYMTISQCDIDESSVQHYQQEKGIDDDDDDDDDDTLSNNNTIGIDNLQNKSYNGSSPSSSAAAPPPFGSIFSLTQLRQRFGGGDDEVWKGGDER